MDPISKNTIWRSKLDERYMCLVERVEPSQGKLTIHDKSGQLLFLQDVEITDDAKSGADLRDISRWQETCISFIDDQTKGSDNSNAQGQNPL